MKILRDSMIHVFPTSEIHILMSILLVRGS